MIIANCQTCKDQVYEDASAFACHVASARRKVGSSSQTSSTDDKGEACSLRAAMVHLHLHDICDRDPGAPKQFADSFGDGDLSG